MFCNRACLSGSLVVLKDGIERARRDWTEANFSSVWSTDRRLVHLSTASWILGPSSWMKLEGDGGSDGDGSEGRWRE